ncbi:MAG: deoxynucleoside kinase [Mollicutes bacterium]|nr:deoxynucleoside kinase [Mollicutes bacterium]MDD7715793.1 deoxynucleoside kinase [Mollicutes bacterium]
MVVIVGGMIGIGKTTTSKMLGKETGLKVYYESVEGNKVLPLFYTSSKEEKEKYRYPFLLQLSFLRSRFHAIKEALKNDNAIMDRSIYEDYYFAKKNFELGNINEMEMDLYEGLLSEMMDELNLLTKKSPDVMVYLHGSFETVLNRIKERGRSFELDSELVSYYKFLYDGYDEWVHSSYKASPIISIDVDKKDIVYNESDKKEFLEELSRYNKIK